MPPDEAATDLNRILGERAVAFLRKLMPDADEAQLRKIIVDTMFTVNMYGALIKQRRDPNDIAALRYFLRILEHNATPEVTASIAIGDALFHAMQGD